MKFNEVNTKSDFFQYASEHMHPGHKLINCGTRYFEPWDMDEEIFQIVNGENIVLIEFSTVAGILDKRASNNIDDRFEY